MANFRHIPLLELGVESRADLVANLLLYIPFGLLLCGSIAGGNPGPVLLATGALVSLLIAATVALGIEFTQQFFAPRTVSLNDIFAELAGSIMGIILWPVIGIRLVHLIRSIFRGGANARNAALIAYALGFAVLSIFPYDFLLSYGEWRAKLASENVGWLLVPHCGGRCLLRLVPEALSVAPLAMLFFRFCASVSHTPACSRNRSHARYADRRTTANDCVRDQPGCIHRVPAVWHDAGRRADPAFA